MAMRLPPKGPAQAYKTYRISAPLSTHFRPATCEEVGCPFFLGGWKIHLESLTPELRETARKSGRKFTELNVAAGETYLMFEAGQRCFQASQHRTRVERDELFVVRDGDWRWARNRVPTRVHKRAEDWMEDLREHTDRVETVRQRG